MEKRGSMVAVPNWDFSKISDERIDDIESSTFDQYAASEGSISIPVTFDPFEDIMPTVDEKKPMRIILVGIFLKRILEGESVITKIDNVGVQGKFDYIGEHIELTLLSKFIGLWLVFWIALIIESILR
jgi:hypothetical protein